MKYHIHKIKNLGLPEVLNNYLNYMSNIQNNSESTIDGYKLDIIVFFRYLKLYRHLVPVDIEFETIDIRDIDDEFIKSITLSDLHCFLKFTEDQRNNSSITRARKVAVLKSFFKYLHSRLNIINGNPALDLQAPKLSKRQPVYLTLEESEKLLGTAQSIYGRNRERDYCIITMFLNCGLRLSELCNIELKNIREDILMVIGKGDKERSIYLNEACLESIKEYIKIRNVMVNITDTNTDFLFLSEQKTKINKRTVQRIVKKFIIGADLDASKYSVHKLRHTAATLLYNHGNVDIISLQMILGHENIATTTIYTHVDEEKLRVALRSNPLNKQWGNHKGDGRG